MILSLIILMIICLIVFFLLFILNNIVKRSTMKDLHIINKRLSLVNNRLTTIMILNEQLNAQVLEIRKNQPLKKVS